MASFGKIDLGVSRSEILCGAGFALNKPASCDLNTDIANGRVIIQKGSSVIIIQYKKKISELEILLDTAYTDAQKALDILAMSKRYFHSLPIAHYEHLLWTKSENEIIVRVQNSASLNTRIEASWVTINASNGVTESSENTPLPNWHEAFRYFRYAQLRDDLYAAYREAFLAAEALLSSYAPRNNREQETAWHLRANRQLQLAGLDFSTIVNNSGIDPVDTFVSEQFKAQRCAHFHSKAGNDHFLPGVLSDRRLVTDSLEKLVRYLIESSRIICGVQSLVGILTFDGMKAQIETFANELTFAVSPDFKPAFAEDIEVSPNKLEVTELRTLYEGIVDGLGHEFGFIGRINVKDMKSKLVVTTASRLPEGIVTRGTIPELDLEGIDKFEYRQIFYFAGNAGLKGGFAL